MEENKTKKKKKLTLSLSSKKKIEPISYAKGVKTSVVVEKKFHRKKSNISSNFSKGSHQFKQNINTKKSTPNKDRPDSQNYVKRNFEIREIAEQRATKRFKGIEKQDEFKSYLPHNCSYFL